MIIFSYVHLCAVYRVPIWRYLGSKKTFSIDAAAQVLHISNFHAEIQPEVTEVKNC